MFDVVIIGAGPRGLALALECKLQNIDFKIIDPTPLNTWKSLDWYSFQMRSPLSFDLVAEPKSEYSLVSFLARTYPENKDEFITRKIFTEYLDSVLQLVKQNLVLEKVVGIYANKVKTESGQEYKGEKIVIASGSVPKRSANFYDHKVVSPEQIKDQSQLDIVVIGSGQVAAEYVGYFAKTNQVTWVIKHKPRIYQYPIPDSYCWGIRDGFSNYFKRLSHQKKLDYIGKVKKWQPSITPYVNRILESNKNNFKFYRNQNLEKFRTLIANTDYVLIALGQEFDLVNYPLKVKLKTLAHHPKLPIVKSGFKTSIPSIRITGLGAVFYDGLRQGSISSAAATAKEIIEFKN